MGTLRQEQGAKTDTTEFSLPRIARRRPSANRSPLKNRRASDNEDFGVRARRETGGKVVTFVEDFATQLWRQKTIRSARSVFQRAAKPFVARFLLINGVLASICSGCTPIAMHFYRPPQIGECETKIPSTDTISGNFVRRLRLHTTANGISEGYEVIVQKHQERLTVVALTRFGARVFSIIQDGDRVNVDAPHSAMQAISPRNVLLDLSYWPLKSLTADTRDVRLTVNEDTRTATVENLRCQYRTIIVELSHDRR